MKKYIIKRVLIIIPLLVIISLAAFILINLSPQDPATAALLANGIPDPSQELIEQTREELGLNGPFLVRYVNWMENAIHLDFDKSYVYKTNVAELIIPRFINTVKLVTVSAIVVIIVSVLIGMVCAANQNKPIDRVTRGIMFILTAMPNYWIAIILMFLLSYKFRLLPTSGKTTWQCYILPVMSLSITYITFYFRLIRNSMLENKNENYVLYENACGLKKSVVTKHILRNSLQTAVAGFCMSIPGMLGGSVVIENIFAWPGIGRLCVTSIFNRDLPIIQAYILLLAFAFLSFNLFGDIVNALINPKLRAH